MMKTANSRLLGSLSGATAFLGAAIASAQAPADGLIKTETASSGSTDVATEGFEAPVTELPPEETDATEFKVSAGGIFATGNSRLTAMTGASRFRVRRENSQLTAAAAANYTRTKIDGESQTTVRNFQGKMRFDRFLGEGFAIFISQSARNDKFQGLVLRMNTDPGVAYYLLDRPKTQLWTELGYDYQYDIRRLDAVEAAAANGTTLDRIQSRHSGRLFLGYDNNLNEAVSFNTGLEYLQAIPDTEYWRLNWDVGLTSQIANKLSIATTFGLRFDNTPLPEIRKTDTVTSVALSYQFL